jgi:hypothetical protein
MLAYVFWHRPRAGVSPTEYESRLCAFHDQLDVPSASFRLDRLPFGDGGGYEDWYLVEGWSELGELNLRAVAGARAAPHDASARLAAEGWGGVYALLRGDRRPPESVRWMAKPAGEGYQEFIAGLAAQTVWQRQMLLGPAPEFCLASGNESAERVAVYPPAGS